MRRQGDAAGGRWYRQLVELSPDAILVHDGKRIAFGNRAALRLAGASRPEQLMGLPVERFLAPPYLKSVEAQLTARAAPTALTPPVRDTFWRLDGSSVAVEVRALGFVDEGHPTAHLVLREITERIAAEESLRRMVERLDQAKRLEAIGTLAGGVAHEVNNMMGVVLGFGESLLQDDALPEAQRADVREILKAADRAATVTRQLLAFSRRAVHRPRVVDLGEAVRDAEPVIRQVLSGSRQLVLETGEGPPALVDPGQLQELLINLALNARDAMPEGGTLTMTATTTTLADEVVSADGRVIPKGPHATVSVRDTGVGMDAEVQARIFEPFYTTKPVGEGTGLGLAAALGILVQHGGFVTVDSAPGQGSTFTAFLPILPAEALAPRPEAEVEIASPPAARGATVLVVDDEPAVRAVTVRTLERGGYRVLEAHDGLGALAVVEREGPPSLVLTDLTMPGLGGAALALQLRERWPALPILLMSGYSAEELSRQGGIAAGAELIQKPFSAAELTARVSAALAQPEGTAEGEDERVGDTPEAA